MSEAANPVEIRIGSATGITLLCEHAGSAIPPDWRDLGLSSDMFTTHFAQDIGARAVALQLSSVLDATVVAAVYSRLFFDINREPDDWECIRPDMGGIPIPGNVGIDNAEKGRRDRISRSPFDAAVLNHLHARGVLVSIHSFSPVFNGLVRATEIGVLRTDDCPISAGVLGALRHDGRFVIGDNDPYDLRTAPMGTIQRLLRHSGRYGFAIEIRNDLIADEAGITAVAKTLAAALAPYATHGRGSDG
jgi:predicted N-formylglutamate amidohydrolase